MKIKRIYKPLTEDQIKRGVIYSSTLLENEDDNEMDATIHEVYKSMPLEEQKRIISNLNDLSFFEEPFTDIYGNVIAECQFKVCVIRK